MNLRVFITKYLQKYKKRLTDLRKKINTPTLLAAIGIVGLLVFSIFIKNTNKPANQTVKKLHVNQWATAKRLPDTQEENTFTGLLMAAPGDFNLKPLTFHPCVDGARSVTFNWEPSVGAGAYFVMWKANANFDPRLYSPSTLPQDIERQWATNNSLKKDGFTPGITLYYSVSAFTSQGDTDGTLATNHTFSERIPLCNETTPTPSAGTGTPTPSRSPTPINSQYTLEASFDKNTYKVGDPMRLCYKLTPTGTPYHVKAYDILNGTKESTPGEWEDNGIGGGGCLSGEAKVEYISKYQLKMEAYINSTLAAEASTQEVAVSAAAPTATVAPTTTSTATPTTSTTAPTPTTTSTSTPTVSPTSSATITPTTTPCTSPVTTRSLLLVDPSLDTEEWSFVEIINNHRQGMGRAKLKVSVKLTTAAEWMSNDMATSGRLDHTDSRGRSAGERIASYGYPINGAGENIALSGSAGQKAFDDWLTSSGHKANMESGGFTHMGISRVKAPSGNFWYWTNTFGASADTEITPPVENTNPTPTTGVTTATPRPGESTPAPTARATTPTPDPCGTTNTLTIPIKLAGIGPKNANNDDNPNPRNSTRTINVRLLDSSNTPITINGSASNTIAATYSPSNSIFSGSIAIGSVPDGNYTAILKLDNSLSKKAPVVIKRDTANSIPTTAITLGDIVTNNVLDIADYTIFIACIKGAASCSQTLKTASDLNDNGKVDINDITILQRGFRNPVGE